MVSSFPQNIIWGTAMLTAAAALVRGGTATVVESAPGRGAGSGGDMGASGLRKQAAAMLKPYARTI